VPLHRLLEMQLSQCHLRLEDLSAEIQTLLHHVDEVYSSSDAHRAMIQRSLPMASQDLQVRNRELMTQQICANAARENAPESAHSLRLASEGADFFDGFLRDVTDEENTPILKATLAVVEAFRVGVVSATLTGEIVNWNQGALLLYGCTSQEMRGVHITRLVEPDQRAELQDALDTIAKGGVAPASLETRHTQPDGRQAGLTLHLSPLRDSNGRIFGILLAMQEMPNPKEVRSGDGPRAVHVDAMKQLDGALAVIAHEIRTPLGGIRATLELLTGKFPCDSTHDRLVKAALEAIVQASEVVNDLLEVTRISNGCAEWTWSEFDLSSAVDIAVSAFQAGPLPAPVAFHWEVAPADTRMWGDLQAVARLLLLLLTNARTRTTAGEIALRITTSEAGSRTVQIEVTDTGRGMSTEALSYFDKPFVLDSSLLGQRLTRRTCVELAICKGISAAHGGQMRINSSPDAGTTVEISMKANLSEPVKCAVSELPTGARR
jgi:PAS domain S-box-containing protein